MGPKHVYHKRSIGERLFGYGNYVFFAVFSIVALYPFWYMLITSFSDPVELRTAYFWPASFYYANYWLVFKSEGIGNAYLISVLRVLVAVPLMLLVTGAAAFAITRRELYGRKGIILYFFLSLFFSGGLIPHYMVLRTLGLLNNFWIYVIPTLFQVWTMIVMKTSFQSLPQGLVEAALMDGAGYLHIFLRIILPLSLPMLATLGLFSAVSHWNEWFIGMFYVTNSKLKPLQTFLRELLSTDMQTFLTGLIAERGDGVDDRMIGFLEKLTPRSLEAAYIMASTIPILLVYPFLQRYFVKGVLIGSIKE